MHRVKKRDETPTNQTACSLCSPPLAARSFRPHTRSAVPESGSLISEFGSAAAVVYRQTKHQIFTSSPVAGNFPAHLAAS